MTDQERYQELLSLLSHGLIRYAHRRGLLERTPAEPLISDCGGRNGGGVNDQAVRALHSRVDGPAGQGD